MPRGGGDDGGGESGASATNDVPVTAKMKRTSRSRTSNRPARKRARTTKRKTATSVTIYGDLKIPIKDMD